MRRDCAKSINQGNLSWNRKKKTNPKQKKKKKKKTEENQAPEKAMTEQ